MHARAGHTQHPRALTDIIDGASPSRWQAADILRGNFRSLGRYGSFSLAAADIVREYGNESTLRASLELYAKQVWPHPRAWLERTLVSGERG